jgi:hypothetical protein
MCAERGKNWNGSDPTCAFAEGDRFDAANWNCATVNGIRNICGDWVDDTRDRRVDFQSFEDQKYATILINSIDLERDHYYALWVTWYKHRGRTEQMWLLGGRLGPEKPTEDDLRRIIAVFSPAPVISEPPHSC